MSRIVVMAPALASQIAAGEVVERPASAVKELVENALDAGATRCDIEIDGGGVTRISVADDGAGMSEPDAVLCLERHATSKLARIEDLGTIGTYGFRGEALPSIASVSRFELVTRTADSEQGISVTTEGGNTPTVRPVGTAVGTRVDVHDLFFNVLARRKFLRSSSTESGHVTDVVESAALCNPEVTFTLTRDGRKTRQWLRAKTLEERAKSAISEELAPCRGTRGPVTVEAFLGRPEHARPGTRGLSIFVNGRVVRDRALAHTVAQAYGSVLERGRYPRGVVHLTLPPTLVDVNVHPQKAEVRFTDARATSDAVYQILSGELARAFQLPAPPRSQWAVRNDEPRPPARLRTADVASAAASVDAPFARGGTDAFGSPAPARNADGAPPLGGIAAWGAPSEAPTDADRTLRGDRVTLPDDRAPLVPTGGGLWACLDFVAQVRRTYLLCEGPDGLYVIDQHAAAERVNFDRLRKQYLSRAVPSQALLFPLTMAVRPEEAELVEQKGDELGGLGLDVRVRGPETLSVHTVPRLLARANPENLVRDLLAEVQRTGNRAFSDAVDLALATMACHGSIRAGDELSAAEARALLASLDQADFAGHCPHGRPVVASFTWSDLERRVGRR